MRAIVNKNEVIGLIISILIILTSIQLLKYAFSIALVSFLIGVYIFILFLPSLFISILFNYVKATLKETYSIECGGLPRGGLLIGYTERSMIFLAFLILFFGGTLSYRELLSFLSFIVAGKAIFRFSSKDSTDRSCADYYILGTFLSILLGLFFSWLSFYYLTYITAI